MFEFLHNSVVVSMSGVVSGPGVVLTCIQPADSW